MLPRSNRISVGQFDTIMEKGRVVHSPLFLVRILSGQADTKIAAVASKKVAKTAVVRNKTRRRIYEAVKDLKGNILNNHILIFAKPAVVSATLAELNQDLRSLFVKSGLLR